LKHKVQESSGHVHKEWEYGYKLLALVVSLLSGGLPLCAQSAPVYVASPLSFELKPAFQNPLGETAAWFTVGGGADLEMRYRLPQSIFFVTGGLGYSNMPIKADTSASSLALRAGGGIYVPLADVLSLRGYALGGYYLASYNDFSLGANNPYLAGGAGIGFALTPAVRLLVSAQYDAYLGLYQGLRVGAGIDIAVGKLGGNVEILGLELQPMFPALYKYYKDHPVGTLDLKSNLRAPATNIETQVYIKEYMDAPESVAVAGKLEPGQTRSIDLYTLLSDRILTNTEGKKVAAEVSVSFKVEGQTYRNKRVVTLALWGRNAMTWDDTRKAAVYVTAKDPEVLNFARSVSSYASGRETRPVCFPLQAAIALHEALDLYGLNYAPSPETPYSLASERNDVIDFLQFPRETFQYRAGDCSDLSILYASMFHAIGIDAAFITVPGHIFIAFDTGLDAYQAQRELIPPTQFIDHQGRAWIPLEVTSLHEGFCEAWELGIKQWNEHSMAGQAEFCPIAEAWSVYQPVGLPGADVTVVVPPMEGILTAYNAEMQKYLDAVLSPRIADLQAQIQESGKVQAMNNLGVLYAKFGRPEEAEMMFRQALAQSSYQPALLNLGHLYFQRKEWGEALILYQQANTLSPSNPQVLLSLARVYQEMQKYAEARGIFDQLAALNPELAARFQYLGKTEETGTKAAEATAGHDFLLWEAE